MGEYMNEGTGFSETWLEEAEDLCLIEPFYRHTTK